jgi:hypothetical protein
MIAVSFDDDGDDDDDEDEQERPAQPRMEGIGPNAPDVQQRSKVLAPGASKPAATDQGRTTDSDQDNVGNGEDVDEIVSTPAPAVFPLPAAVTPPSVSAQELARLKVQGVSVG